MNDTADRPMALACASGWDARLHDIVTQALEQTVNGLVITDVRAPGQPIVHVNAGFERITGYAAPEVIGRNCRFLQGFDCEQPGVARMREAVALGEACTAVVRNYRKDGSLFWNRVEIGPVRDPVSGELTHYFALQTDVTAEHEALALREHFLSNAAHELRSPLGTMRAFIELMQMRSGEQDPNHELLVTVHRHADRLIHLVDDMLELAELEAASKSASGIQPVQLAVVLERLRSLLPPDDGCHPVRIEPAEPALWVQAHPQRLEQVLLNLQSNAIKYSPAGGEVRWSVRPGQQPGWVRVSVSDRGIGMTPEEQNRLFTRFFRARPDIPGTGLGLVIVRELIERMGGHITVRSQPGAGTTFTLHLRTATP
jgi:PAS domain S-box-containing protein